MADCQGIPMLTMKSTIWLKRPVTGPSFHRLVVLSHCEFAAQTKVKKFNKDELETQITGNHIMGIASKMIPSMGDSPFQVSKG